VVLACSDMPNAGTPSLDHRKQPPTLQNVFGMVPGPTFSAFLYGFNDFGILPLFLLRLPLLRRLMGRSTGVKFEDLGRTLLIANPHFYRTKQNVRQWRTARNLHVCLAAFHFSSKERVADAGLLAACDSVLGISRLLAKTRIQTRGSFRISVESRRMLQACCAVKTE
jgi:hypothetical protein